MEKDNVLTTNFLWRGVSAAVFVGTGFILFNERLQWHRGTSRAAFAALASP
jgi:multidrug transporter EmrE-like cation transporter